MEETWAEAFDKFWKGQGRRFPVQNKAVVKEVFQAGWSASWVTQEKSREKTIAYFDKLKALLAELGYPCVIGEPIENKIREIVGVLKDYETAAMERSET